MKYKNIFAKGCVPDWSEDVFVIKKVKNTVLWTYVISDFNNEETEKVINYISDEKGMIINLIVGLIKNILLYKMSCFQEPYDHSKNEIKVYLNLPNYPTKSNLKNATGINKSTFAKKTYLASLKSDVDELDIDKLKKCTKWFIYFEK